MSAPSATADPMLQGTYQQDDRADYPATSAALDSFDQRLASGQALHSPPAGARGAHGAGARPQKAPVPAGSGAPPMRPTFAPTPDAAKGRRGSRATEEEQAVQLERDAEVQAVRALGRNDDDGQDSD